RITRCSLHYLFCFVRSLPPPLSLLFPYTTLFRSQTLRRVHNPSKSSSFQRLDYAAILLATPAHKKAPCQKTTPRSFLHLHPRPARRALIRPCMPRGLHLNTRSQRLSSS